ncbi:energy transducer TonB [Sphingomonas sp. LT1P40]|uniref:energy transducer TonB n=1 Tax=Alteristakelama amylovorans TaxID=3096166 RepID=UPI002FCA02F9
MKAWQYSTLERDGDLAPITDMDVAKQLIKQGHLSKDSFVYVYDEDGAATGGKASSFEQFAALLEAEPDAVAESVKPRSRSRKNKDQPILDKSHPGDQSVSDINLSADMPASEADEPVSVQNSDSDKGERQAAVESSDALAQPVPGPSKRRQAAMYGALALIIVFIIAFIYVEPRALDEKWTIRTTKTYLGQAESGLATKILRGTALKVVEINGTWARITDGYEQYSFIRTADLTDTVPPELDASQFSGMRQVLSDGTILTKADDGSPPLKNVIPRESVDVVGRLKDMDQGGQWLEVILVDRRIGYIRARLVLGGVVQVAQPTVPEPPQPPVVGPSPPPPNRGPCDGLRSVDWAHCRWPELSDLRDQLNQAYAAARMRNPEVGEALEDFRARLTRCGRQRTCYEAAYRTRVAELDAVRAPPPPPPPPMPEPSSAAFGPMPADSRFQKFIDPDYPEDARRLKEEGTVSAKLRIDRKGRVKSCTIRQSSGSRSLDKQTCILLKKTRFRPARDAAGVAIDGDYDTPAFLWTIPDR